MTRRLRLFTVLVSLFSLLLSSAALAGYACPGVERAVVVAQMAEMDAPCAETMSKAMDDAQPGLCHAHCQNSSQSADHFQPPVLADLVQLGGALTVAEVAFRSDRAQRISVTQLQRNSGPPLAVRNCCFRI